MTEHKTDMNITEKLNNTSIAEYRTTMNIIEKLNSTFTKELSTEHNYTLVNQTIDIRECLHVDLTNLSDFMIAIKVLLTSFTLVYHCQFDLNRSKRFKSVEFYENICKLFR